MVPRIRVMTPADIPGAVRLKDIAGWNQTSEDWARFLQSDPEGCLVAECEGRVAGTVTTIIYEGRLAWVGMVLVDPDFRRRGIGTALLDRAVAYLEARRIPCIKLDATPQGEPLYERLGFKVEYGIERCVLRRTVTNVSSAHWRSEDSSAVLAIDRDIFGADRSSVLRSIAIAAPELVVLAPQGGSLEGYALGRKGSLADHLGPWIARNARAARELLWNFLERSRRDVILVDVLTDHPWARILANEKGFDLSRPLTRMYRGENRHPGRADLVYAILGPEFG
jgi:GNAT superfamily N-acetyltransferase